MDNLENQETLTISKTDYDKAIQSAEDKLRTKYSNQIKQLQDKITELTPEQKSDREIELEKRLAEVEAKERRLTLQETLQSKNIDNAIADFLKDDIDIEKFETTISNIMAKQMEKNGYKPINHQNNEGVTLEKWNTMSYSQKQEVYKTNPELAKRLMNIK